MTSNPRGRDQRAATSQASQRANLPAIQRVRSTDPVMQRFIDAVIERLEVREGERGNPFERTVTFRDLADLGLVDATFFAGRPLTFNRPQGQDGGILVSVPGGGFAPISIEEFADRIRGTRLYQSLMKSLDDPTRFDDLPERVRQILLPDIAAQARLRGAEVREIEHKIQTAQESFAAKVEEVTAAVSGSVAGVRQVAFASATAAEAAAGVSTQIRAALGEPGTFLGNGVTLEQLMFGSATKTGLYGQYTMKIQAGGAIAGFGLAVDAPIDGPVTSAFLIAADKFAIVAPNYSGGFTNVPPANAIPFGVDTSTGTIYLNGTIRINANGPSLSDLSGLADSVLISSSADYFKVSAGGESTPETITLTANLSGSVSGFVSWSASAGYSGSLPPGGTTNTLTIDSGDIVGDAATFTATIISGGDEYADSFTLAKLRDGSDAYTALLTNEAHTVPADPTGVVTSFSGAGGEMRIYRGATRLTSGVSYAIAPGGNPASLTASIGASGAFSVTGAGLWATSSLTTTLTLRAAVTETGETFDKVFTITKSRQGDDGDDGNPGENAYGVRVSASSQLFQTAKSGAVTPSTITFTAIPQNLSSLGPVSYTWTTTGGVPYSGSGSSITISNAQMGSSQLVRVTVSATAGAVTVTDEITVVRVAEGVDAVVGYLTNESHTISAGSDGVVSSYSGASGQFKVFRGAVDVTSSSSFAYVSSTGFSTAPSASINASGAYAISAGVAAAGDIATVTYRATHTYAGQTYTVDKVFTLTKSKQGVNGENGPRGSVRISQEVADFVPYPGRTGGRARWARNSGGQNATSAANFDSDAIGFICSALGLPASPSNMRIGDTFIAKRNSQFVAEGYWDGSQWLHPGVVLDGNLLVTGSVATSALAAGQVTTQNASGFAGFGVSAPSFDGPSLPVVLSAVRTQTDRPALHVSDNSSSAPSSGSYWVADFRSRANGVRIDFGQGVTGFSSVGLRFDGRGAHAIYASGAYVVGGIAVENTGTVSGNSGYAIRGHLLSSSSTGNALEGRSDGFGAGVNGRGNVGPGVEGVSSVGNGGLFSGNATRGAIRLLPQTNLPTSRELGSFCTLTDGNLYWANGSHWFRVTGLVQAT